MEPLLTVNDVATILKINVLTVRRMIKRGNLPCHRVGRQRRFTEKDIERFLELSVFTPRKKKLDVLSDIAPLEDGKKKEQDK